MASHGGQLTFAQKKMLSMQAQVGNSSLATSQYSTGPHTAVVRQESVPFHSDVEIHDSAPTSTDGSPPVNSSDTPVQSNFSAAAKPFTPSDSAMLISSTMAPPVTSIVAPPVTSTMAPPVTPVKRAPPHRAVKDHTPVALVAAPKPDLPFTPILSDHSAAPSPKRRAGPHSKLGPHAPRSSGSLSTVSISPAPPAQVQAQDSVTSRATTPAIPTQDAWVDVQQPKSEPEAWVDVQEPQVEMDIEQPSPDQVDMKTKQPSVQATPIVSAQDRGAPTAVEPEQSATQTMPPQQMSAPDAVLKSATPEAASHSPLEQIEAQTESTGFSLSEEMSTETTTTTRRYGRNEYLPMLLDMTDTAKGRELIHAFADHIHASGDTSMRSVATPHAQQEIWMEFSGGQRLAATVPQNTTLINAIKEFAKMTLADQSEVRIVLKVGDKDPT